MSLFCFPPFDGTRRRLLGLAGAATAAGLAGCAGGGGLAPHFTLSESRLQELVERQFPRRQRLLELVDVTLAAPQLRLLPERNRLAADWQVEAADRFGGTPRRGRLALETGLRLEPSDLSLRLAQVAVQRLEFEGGALPLAAQGLAAAIAERLLEDLSVYRMGEERAQQFRSLGFSTGSVSIGRQGVDIALQRPGAPPPATPFQLPPPR